MMRDLDMNDVVNVGGGVGEAPSYPSWPDRGQTEGEIEQFLEMLRERERQQAVRGR
jgi:hypothetical protein